MDGAATRMMVMASQLLDATGTATPMTGWVPVHFGQCALKVERLKGGTIVFVLHILGRACVVGDLLAGVFHLAGASCGRKGMGSC